MGKTHEETGCVNSAFKNSLFVFCINEETKSKIKQFNSMLKSVKVEKMTKL